ncbi:MULTISPECIES: 4-hydroxy-tetrahydrodipicolinate reductase [Saliphagus]|uniref:4-hydroxy-tetrahydrodipicolinate reductase n=1 Tax=Saliphagus infecundisoli TaxID=1849069 RepID=A0ABD5QJN1_9EURY|nr:MULTISPECIES: 4-hydroxy-tetrahydrodipicolinate reductase [Saliphagus]
MTVAVGVTGATGRMGREVLAAAGQRGDCEIAFAVSESADAGTTVEGYEVEPAGELEDLVADREPDAVVDFTVPEATAGYAAACGEAGVSFVTGTTGLGADEITALDRASDAIPVLHAPNFSRGVSVLVEVVREAVGSLPGYDVELAETHHNGKRDAPSGTAERLLETIEAEGDFSGRKHGREGDDPRVEGEIGVHALRAGAIAGEHEVLLADDHEELRLTHRAADRGVFAAGALDAAVWLADREPGRYEFADVLG